MRELRERTAEVLRRVREERAEYVITHQGRPVAMLLPVDEVAMEAATLAAGKRGVAGGWELYARVAEALRQAWPKDVRTQTVIDSIRRG